ncbi:MAG: undecaprenyl-phosphate glucose phosphotransferase [Anaerolineae bacterium]
MNRQNRVKTAFSFALFLSDLALVTLGFGLGYWLRANIPVPALPEDPRPLSSYSAMWATFVISTLVVFYLFRLYHMARAASRIDEAYAIFSAVSIGMLVTIAITELALKNSVLYLDYPRGMIVYAWVVTIGLVTAGRAFHRQVVRALRRRGYGCDRMLIVGSGEIARAIVQKIQWSPYLGYELVGIVDGNDQREVLGVPIIGQESELPQLIDAYEVDEVIIALPEASHRELLHLTAMCQRGKVSIKVFPDVFQIMASGVTIDDLGGLPLLNVRDVQYRGWKLSLKRAMDVVLSAIGLVLLSPLMVLTAVAVKLTSPGPAFYCQERMGLDGRPIQVIKFRSMRADAEADGPGWTVENDPRRTRLGQWMRAKNWDEIPQLINVLIGDMSLVGPRPERPIYVQRFQQGIPRYMERHREKAGLTGWAQVNGLRGDTSIVERTKYDLWYIENWSLWLDFKILIRTAFQTVAGLFSNRNSTGY